MVDFIGSEVIEVEVIDTKPVLPTRSETILSQIQFKQVIKLDTILYKISQTLIEVQPQLVSFMPQITVIQEYRDFKIVIFTYKVETETTRYILEYNKATQKTILKESTLLSEIKPVFVETDISANGDICVVSNSVSEIQTYDEKITSVIKEVETKVTNVEETIKTIEVVSNDYSNEYIIVAENENHETVQLEVVYEKNNGQIIFTDIQTITEEEQTYEIEPIVKPIVCVPPEEFHQPAVENVLQFINSSVSYTEVEKVQKVEGCISTNYDVTVTT